MYLEHAVNVRAV